MRGLMNFPVSAIEEASDQELISVTGTVISSELNPSLRNKCKEELQKESFTSLDDNEDEKYVQNHDHNLNHMKSQSKSHGKSETIQHEARKPDCCWCCKFCMLLLKCTGIICYVLCCPPIPEMITRKLAFHPLRKGKTYVICGKDTDNNLVRTNNAKKASKLTSLKLEVQLVIEERPISVENVVASVIKTTRGSYLPILRIGSSFSNDQSIKDLVILFSQPNSSDLGCYFQSHGLTFSNISKLLKVDLYAYDYSGYGISTGSPSEKNIYADIEAAYKYISESQGPHVRIVLLGYSIGTVASIYMASKHPPNLCGIVLLAPLASALRLYIKTNRSCCLDRFLSCDRAPEINVPVLICHGCMDNVIPKSHSEILVERFPRAVKPFYVEQANHLTIFSKQNLSVFFRIHYFLFHETDLLKA